MSLVWIEAKKHLPASKNNVLCWKKSEDDGECFAGYWNDDSKSWINSSTEEPVTHVTHWAELWPAKHKENP